MAIKKSLCALLLLMTVPGHLFAAEKNLALPPVVEPEQFDRPMVNLSGVLTLQDVLLLTLEHSPELAEQAWAVRAREIEQISAGLLPNPELSLEVENFAGTNSLSGFKSAETTLSLSQLIELGDKRMKRVQLAAADHSVARWKYEIKRVDLLALVSRAFINVLSDQEQLAIANEILILAEEVYQTVAKRVSAGKVASFEEIKARVELSKSRLALIRAQRQLTISRLSLVKHWGATEASFNKAIGDINGIFPLPDLDSVVKKLNTNPDLARWMAEISRQQNAVELEQADTIPDFTLSLGLRHFNQINNDNDVAVVAMISMPLFIFDKKRTGVRQSQAELNQAIKQQEAAEVRVSAALLTSWERLQIFYEEVRVIRDEVMPNAEQAFNLMNKTYQLGKIGLLELLDSQRTYFELQQQFSIAKREYHTLIIGVERLIGSPVIENSTFNKSDKGEKK